MAKMTIARSMIVDPSSIFRDGIRGCLNQGGHLVLGEAQNLAEALAQLEALQPNLALLGPNLAENESLAICREIRCRWSTIKTIIITPYVNDPLFRADAIYAGAAGCLPPSINHKNCLVAIAKVVAGQSLFQHDELAHGYQPIRLTARQREILKLLGEEKNDKQIAKALGTSLTTIRNHIQNALEKLEVHNRQEALRRAKRRGWFV